jgi:hypothetical protein
MADVFGGVFLIAAVLFGAVEVMERCMGKDGE